MTEAPSSSSDDDGEPIRGDSPADAVEPWGLVLGLVVVLSGLACFGVIGLGLAVVGAYHSVLAVVLTLPAWALVVRAGWPLVSRAKRTRTTRSATIAALAVVGFVFVLTAWNARYPGQHVVVNRDPGSYVTTAQWISDHGSLDVALADQPFGNGTDFTFDSAAVYPDGDHLEFQFAHMLSVVMALGDDAGGDGAMLRVNVLLGAIALIALYALALRILRRPWLAVLPVVAIGLSIPQIWFSRDSYSEILLQALLFGGLWLLALARRSATLGPAVAAGIVLGAAAVTRIDAALLLIGGVVVLAVDCYNATRGDTLLRRRAGAFALAALAPLVVGLTDIVTKTGGYVTDLGTEFLQVWLVVAASIVIAVVVVRSRRRVPRLRAWLAAHRGAIAWVGAGMMAAALVFLWGPRRFVSMPHRAAPDPLMVALESAEELAADGTRTYAERSMEWISWYIGPVTLAIAVIGAALLTRELVLRRQRDALGLYAAFCAGGLLYLWRPSIFPDQIWAMRRFLPIVVPSFLVFAALVLVWALGRSSGRSAALRVGVPVLVVVAAAAMIWAPASATRPVRTMRTQTGYLPTLDVACDQIPEDAAVLVLPPSQAFQIVLPQTIRSFCDVPVAAMIDELGPRRAREIARQVEQHGLRLYLLAGDAESLDRADARSISVGDTILNPSEIEQTIASRPDTLIGTVFRIAVGRIATQTSRSGP